MFTDAYINLLGDCRNFLHENFKDPCNWSTALIIWENDKKSTSWSMVSKRMREWPLVSDNEQQTG